MRAAQAPKRSGLSTAEVIERQALQVFYEKGYYGASIRAIATGANVGIATLFHHFPTKAAILDRILHRAVDAMQKDLDDAVAGVSDPADRLEMAVRALVLAHCERQSESFVAQSELRSVKGASAKAIRQKRRRVQAVFDDAVAEGIAAGEFSCDHPNDVARAIVSMGTQVATWYQRGKGYSPQQVADIYVEMAMRLVGA
jgi:AcrR family transcriptional regulator